MPFLLHRDTRLPLTKPMEWALSSRRGCGVAASTIERELSHIGLFEEWLRKEGLDLADPLTFVESFTPNKIEASLRPWLERDRSRRKVVKLAVGASEIKMRLNVIGEYVDWVLRDSQAALSVRTQPAQIVALAKQRDTIAATLKDVTPSKSHAADKQGLSDQETHAVLDLIDPKNVLCPWGRGEPGNVDAVRHRNQVIVMLMLSFGIRRGDLLKLCVGDVMTHSNEPFLHVRRRPDDPNDPRKNEPNAKTQERMLPLDRFLVRLLDDYILKWRKKLPNAKRTPYLFISSHDGRPMATRSLNGIFETLHDTFPRLHPHVCRHTHNDRLRAVCKTMGIRDKEAEDHARYLNGWLGDNRGIYTKREARLSAQRISAAVQRNLFDGRRDVPF